MIKPVGSDELKPLFVYDPDKHHALKREAQSLPSVVISSQAAGNAVMMGGGYFNPLPGFMNLADALSVAETMRTTSGLFFPVPVLCLLESVDAIRGAKRIALRDPNMEDSPVLAIMDVEAIEEVSDAQMALMTEKVYRTSDPEHPGVATVNSQGRYAVSGPIQVLHFSYFQEDFPDTFRTAVEIRHEIAECGWKRVVAFQTRNPMHLAHEELCHMAMERLNCDGLVIHMLLGKLKPGDIPAPLRGAAIRKMVELYFPPNSAMVTGYGFDMLYAGPREAVLHAYFRQNMGATHFIIGRDHAGVGDYYGAFEAQTIFEAEVPAGALAIEIFKADHTAYSKKLNRVVMMCEPQDHTKEDFVLLSGTKKKLIQQLFWNLILNALQAMEPGGRLSVATARADGSVTVSIRDTGRGIPDRERANIFKPFYTTKHQGTGLGLTISRRIVEQHRGTLTIDSVENAGTTCTVRLPFTPKEEAA